MQKVLEHIKREFKMMRVVIFGLMFFSVSALANIVGQWEGKSNNNTQVFNLKIDKQDNDISLHYIFIYAKGKKINEYSEGMKPLVFKAIGSECYVGQSYDSFTSSYAKTLLCEENGLLYWSKIDEALNTPYLPKYELFQRNVDFEE
ncbi:hypothetical protein [Aliivibrio fischeri]|uniref:hypothetical protein n=1 Tax=Aliivibrio fischeri TaxID=668 RepID=UPI0007C4FB91|nr:hypothetical protein [Aliivibrio fischeri]MCE7553856.1 hypothetical protein [Aliivibrio fischeri]MCE7561292.1 hypothetical protein [Aliivibrio fischeri]MCE7568700.1 hypothetical protein [Aliivibrio fischeri]MUK42540.1 hypothetical protein [Aliivibrio fischeri]MUK93531.1 hypothetical protein [Aliivibrio fischeri]